MKAERAAEGAELWFVTGSQDLYGPDALRQVKENTRRIVEGMDDDGQLPVKITAKPVVTTTQAIMQVLADADAASNCVGVIAWMHTFSPAQMWMPGLQVLSKPLLHLHTQFNRHIPWDTIDMDFMNLNQSAHGGREFGFAATRLRVPRKVVVGHWEDSEVRTEIGAWSAVALAHHDAVRGRIARFGDNMRRVAVTEGNKVSARSVFGYSVEGFGLGDLVEYLETISDAEIDRIVQEYESRYHLSPELARGGERHSALRYAVRQELGIKSFLDDGGFTGFTTSFEVLHGLDQLPGLAPQRLMEQGYGFGAEGDWKTAALLRAIKVMAIGREGGTSFMEDYTYHFDGKDSSVIGAHMLEICPSIAAGSPRIEIHPLGIGGKNDPVRAVFNGRPGPAFNVTIVDLGSRFRMLVNPVEAVAPEREMPKLPVARVLWKPEPDLKVGAAAWILAGGAHHTVYSQAVSREQLLDYARITGIETVVIDAETTIEKLENELRWNELYYRFRE